MSSKWAVQSCSCSSCDSFPQDACTFMKARRIEPFVLDNFTKIENNLYYVYLNHSVHIHYVYLSTSFNLSILSFLPKDYDQVKRTYWWIDNNKPFTLNHHYHWWEQAGHFTSSDSQLKSPGWILYDAIAPEAELQWHPLTGSRLSWLRPSRTVRGGEGGGQAYYGLKESRPRLWLGGKGERDFGHGDIRL